MKHLTGIAFGAMLLAATVLSGCQSSEEKVAAYLASARELQAAGELDKAKLQLRNVFEIDARNVEANIMMADFAESKQDLQTAASHMKRAVGGDEGNVANRQRYARLLIVGGALDEAEEQLTRLQSVSASDPHTLMLRGLLLARRNERAQALEMTAAAYAGAPDDPEVAAAHAAMLLSNSKSEEALALVARAIETHAAEPALRMLQFQGLATVDRREEAVAAMRGLLELTPDQLAAWRVLAIYQVRNSDVAAAEATLREMVAANPASVDAKLMLAGFLGQHDREAAIESLRGFVTEAGGVEGTKLRFALGELYLQDQSLEDASRVFMQIASSDVPADQRLSAQNQLARIALKQDKRSEAQAIVSDILAAAPKNPDALIARALLALSERRSEDAIFDLRLALRERPDSEVAEVLLAHAYMQDSATELAERSYLNALKINPYNERAAVGYAQLRASQQDYARALKTLDTLATGGKAGPAAERLRLQLLLAQKDWRAATNVAGTIADRESRPGFGKYVLALTLQRQEHFEEAIKVYQEVLAEDPGLLGAAGGIAYCYASLGRIDEGIAWLRRFAASAPEVTERRLLLANEMLRNARTAEAVAEYEGVIEAGPTVIEAYQALGGILLRGGDARKAVVIYERGVAANPDALELKLLLAGALEQAGEKTRAEGLYRELLDRVPTLDVAANNLAVLLAGDGSDAARLAEAARVAERFKHSDNPWFADTLGWTYHLQGNHAEAEKLLAKSLAKGAEQGIFNYHFGAVLAALGRPEEAKRHLERAEVLARAHGKFEGYDAAMSLLARLSESDAG